jgi:hypothetical protein
MIQKIDERAQMHFGKLGKGKLGLKGNRIVYSR